MNIHRFSTLPKFVVGLFLLSPYVLAGTTLAPATIPAGCETFTGKYAENGGLRCRVVAYATSYAGKDFGPWVRLISTAPKGYVLRFSEGHIFTGDHKCGVRDEGATAPEQPSHFNENHQREGQPFWAQCIIRERDSSHVMIEFRAQGHDEIKPGIVNGGAEIIAFYNPVVVP